MYDNLDKENKKIESLLEKPPLKMQFIEKRSDIDRSTLYSFDGSFQLLQADIAYISFCLLFVDLFTSKIYTFPMKTGNLLAKKMEQFYKDIPKKRNGKRMRLQTDQEFKQRKIYDLNKKFSVDMFPTSLRGGKAFAPEQKIREFKKKLLRSKRIEKYNKKRIKPNDLIRKATFNLNNVKSVKYGFSPEQIEEKSLNKETGEEFTDIYDFHGLIKV